MLLIPDALTQSDRPAVFDAAGRQWWSYGRLSDAVQKLQCLLAGPRRLAFCFCDLNIPTIINYLALLEAGHATALINSGLDPNLRQRLIERYQPELLLSSKPLPFPTDRYVTSIQGDTILHQAAGDAVSELHPDLAILLSTSGTTGSPKFVRLSRRNILANADSIREALTITPRDRAICSLPFQYSYGLSVLNSHLLAGASLVVTARGLLSSEFWAVCRETGCTSMAGVPYSYQVLDRLKFDDLRVPDLTTLTQAAVKLSPEPISRFNEIMARRRGGFFVIDGQTKATT